MLQPTRLAWATVLAAGLLAAPVRADLADGWKKGTPHLKSAGALAFGPEGILFVGDPAGAAIYAIDTGDTAKGKSSFEKVKGIDEKIAAMLGIEAKDLIIHDLAVNPASGQAYLSVARGRGPNAIPVLLRVSPQGKISEVPLKGVLYAEAKLSHPAEGARRRESITKIAYVKGKLYVAGLSNEEFASTFRCIPFPFKDEAKVTSVEIFHGSHGRFETASPVRTFVPYDIKGEEHLLAAYTCTPLVKVPVAELTGGKKIKGVTVAELGNHNRPLDMIVYKKDGKDYILMANSSRGLMKITTDNIDKVKAITKHVNGTAGLTYQTVEGVKGVQQLDVLDKDHALVLIRAEDKSFNLEPLELP
jgi:hypothetical protein